MADEQVAQSEMQNATEAHNEIEETQSPEEMKAELARVRKALKKANEEAASHRHKAKELDELKSKAEQEKLSEVERLQLRIQELETAQSNALIEQQETRVKVAIAKSAVQLNIVDIEAAEKLISWAEIEYSENGMPENIDALLKDLVKAKPYLVSQTTQQRYSATNPSRSSVTYNDTDALLNKMRQGKLSDAEYAQLSPEIRQKLSRQLLSKKR